MIALKMILRRLFFSSLCFISFTAFAVKDCEISVFLAYDTGAVLWAGNGASAWSDLQLERRGMWLYSYVLQTSGVLGVKTVSINDNDTPENVYDRLARDGQPIFPYIDWNGDWSNWLTPYYPTGHVFVNNGFPVGVVQWRGDEPSTIPLSQNAQGWVSDPLNLNGVDGLYFVSGNSDIGYTSTFTPSWDGGAHYDVTLLDTPILDLTSSNVGGGSSSGSGGSFVFPAVPVGSLTDSGGNTYNNVVTPQYFTVSGIDGSGGNISFTLPDYSPFLNAIGGTLSSHASGVHADLSAINENIKALGQFDTDGVDLSVAPPDYNDYEIDTTEAGEILDSVSGWGFSFGFDSNPIGDFITTIFGNPPTSFGSQDLVWDVDFPIYGDMTVHSSFRLSDWFRPAFRSCILMIVSLIFAIAVAKAVSGAFA